MKSLNRKPKMRTYRKSRNSMFLLRIRATTLVAVLVTLVITLVLCPLPAMAYTIQSFDGSRCYSGACEYWLTGNGMLGPYNQLIAKEYTVLTTNEITPPVLEGVDVFVAAWMQPGSTLSGSESVTLLEWVYGGGSLLFGGQGDSMLPANNQFSQMFNGPTYAGEYNAYNVSLTLVAPEHPILNGPYGVVDSISGLNKPGRWLNVPSSVTVLAELPDGSAAMFAFEYGAGQVVFLDDSGYFAYPPVYTTDHAILWDNTIDWLLPELVVEAAIDIKPQSCPNPLNLASKGVLPVAILGTQDFDVNTIDIASIRLEGVAAIRSNYEDVATPVSDGNECDCNTAGPDGYTDLTLKFDTPEIVGALGDVNDGDAVPLGLTGALSDETPIEGDDCTVVIGKVPRWLKAKKSDVNEDGVIDLQDFCLMAEYWLEASSEED